MAAAVRGSGVLVVVCQGDARLTLLLVTHLRRPDVQVLVVQTVSEGPLTNQSSVLRSVSTNHSSPPPRT